MGDEKVSKQVQTGKSSWGVLALIWVGWQWPPKGTPPAGWWELVLYTLFWPLVPIFGRPLHEGVIGTGCIGSVPAGNSNCRDVTECFLNEECKGDGSEQSCWVEPQIDLRAWKNCGDLSYNRYLLSIMPRGLLSSGCAKVTFKGQFLRA